jgi:hypothetical protein
MHLDIPIYQNYDYALLYIFLIVLVSSYEQSLNNSCSFVFLQIDVYKSGWDHHYQVICFD